MREIKFRAWNIANKCMVDLKKITPLAVIDNLGIDGLFIPFSEQYNLIQFTGLRDSKRTEEYPEGQEIYDRDIVKFSIVSYGPNGETTDSDKIGIIKFSEHETAIVIGDKDSDYFESNLILLGDALRADEEMEVIGNIFENPELLESGVSRLG